MNNNREESLEKLKELTEGIDLCMLTTIHKGILRSRPMSTQEMSDDGVLWFFTSDDTAKVDEIDGDNRVNLSYAKPDDSTYVSISGRAAVNHDKNKMKELWNPVLTAWFPDGLDQPDLALLKVEVEQAEYWETTSGKLVQLFGFVKALTTGESADWGKNKKIEL